MRPSLLLEVVVFLLLGMTSSLQIVTSSEGRRPGCPKSIDDVQDDAINCFKKSFPTFSGFGGYKEEEVLLLVFH